MGEDGNLYVEFCESKIRMDHFHYETFVFGEVVGELPAGIPLTFITTDKGGKVCALSVPLCMEKGAAPIRFERIEK